MKKEELKKILVEEYGYEKEDLKYDAEGKPYTNAKLQAIIKAEEEDAKALEEEATRIKAPKSKLNDSDKILVMNGLTGALVYHSERSNKVWEFNKFGDQDTIEYSELLTMKNRYPGYFTDGWLIVLNKEVQEEFKLTEMYKNIITPENENSIFEMDVKDLDEFVNNLPRGMKVSFVNKAQDKFDNGELHDYRVIKYIQEKFNFSFEDNAPLNDIVSTREKDRNGVIVVDRVR